MRLADPAPVLQYGLCGPQNRRVEKTMSDSDQIWHLGMAGNCCRRVYGGQYPAGGGGNRRIREDTARRRIACWWAAIRAFSARALWPKRRACWPAAGVTPIVIPEAAPTPAIAYAVRTLKTSGSINFTASHNPPEYNGIKYSTPDGAPALPEATKQIEAAIEKIAAAEAAHSQPLAENFETADVKPAFLKRLAELVDLKAIAKSGIKVVYDPFWGAGRGYPCHLLREAGVHGGDGARLSRRALRRPRAGAVRRAARRLRRRK